MYNAIAILILAAISIALLYCMQFPSFWRESRWSLFTLLLSQRGSMFGENKILDVSAPAIESLVDDQYKFVVLTSTGVRRPDNETECLFGILQNRPALGEAAAVRVLGISKLVMNDAVACNTFVKAEYVDEADAGKGKTAAGALAYARALVLDGTNAEGEIASVLLMGYVPGITQTGWFHTTVTTKTTADAVTYSAAELIGGLILRDPNGASRNDVTPTAAQFVAGFAGGIVGSSFEFTIRNTADAEETITLTAGNGVTLSGTMTIAQNNSKRFLCRLDNIDGGTEAVTIYSLGTVVH